MRIETDRVVTVAYTFSNEKGEVLDTSDGREPLTYIQGAGMIKGFETALAGKAPQDAFSFTVETRGRLRRAPARAPVPG